MDDFESGDETFPQAAQKSVVWFEHWSSDALLFITDERNVGPLPVVASWSSRKDRGKARWPIKVSLMCEWQAFDYQDYECGLSGCGRVT